MCQLVELMLMLRVKCGGSSDGQLFLRSSRYEIK